MFRLARWFFISLIRFYKMCVSPLKGRPTCIYIPSCSSYAIEAIEKFGVFRGLGLAVKRVARCNPWRRGGIDPVPDNPKGDMRWLM